MRYCIRLRRLTLPVIEGPAKPVVPLIGNRHQGIPELLVDRLVRHVLQHTHDLTVLDLIKGLISAKKNDDQEAQDPNQKPDEIKFDEQGKNGKRGVVKAAQQNAEIWMRNIQTSPAQLLRRKFAIEAGEQKR